MPQFCIPAISPPFLRFYSLMLTATQLDTVHETACRSIKQLYLLLVSDNIILFVLQKLVRPKRKRDMPVYLKIFFTVEIGYAKEALGKLNTLGVSQTALSSSM